MNQVSIVTALLYTAIGLVMTFSALIVVIFMVKSLRVLSMKKGEQAPDSAVAPPQAAIAQPAEGEIIAVIAAALACCDSAQNPRVVAIKPLSAQPTSAWRDAARRAVLH